MTTLAGKIRAKTFVVTTELTPPKGTDVSDLLAKADALKGYIDGINLTECPRARMAVEPKAVARLLIERGHEPIVQVTARDRNRIAIQADLLGASLLGITNFLFMTGDNPKNGDHPDAKGVFDLTTLEMLSAARGLREGHDLAGNELKGSPASFLGATANPCAVDMAWELDNTRRKIDAGAQFLQTQAIYDTDFFARFLDKADLGDTAMIAGVIPLKSAKMAEWLNGNVPGIRVPQALIDELEAAGPDGEAAKGVEIAARLIKALRPMCAGVHIMAIGWEARVPEILRAGGIRSGSPQSPGG